MAVKPRKPLQNCWTERKGRTQNLKYNGKGGLGVVLGGGGHRNEMREGERGKG